jgi:hypothetical protein
VNVDPWLAAHPIAFVLLLAVLLAGELLEAVKDRR